MRDAELDHVADGDVVARIDRQESMLVVQPDDFGAPDAGRLGLPAR